MKIKDIALSAAYVGQMVVKAICVGAQEIWSAVKYIIFKDPVVEQICATKWGDGKGITEEQAAAVTSLVFAFRGNTEIKNFDELDQFTNVTSLGSECFKGCTNLRTINLSNIEEIGGSCFRESSIVYIDAPKLKSIVGGDNFLKCSNLTGDVSHPLLEGTIPTHAYYMSGISRVVNLGKVTSIDSVDYLEAFGNCPNLWHVHLPETLTNIGNGAFKSCGELREVISDNSTPPTIGSNVFKGTNSALAIYVPDQSVKAYREASGWLSYADKILPMEAYLYGYIKFSDPAVEAICLANWDTNGSGYLNKEEAKAVTSIGTVFKGNTEIVSFNELADFVSVKSIPSSAFFGCTSLAEVSMPDGVTSIESMAFQGCSLLATVNIPSSIETISNTAFYGCPVEIDDFSAPSLKSIGSNAFSDKAKIRKISNLGSISKLSIGQNALGLELEEVVLPATCIEIGGSQFRGCNKLHSINIDGVTKFGDYAFLGCKSLSIDLNLPNIVKFGGNSVFENADIRSLYAPNLEIAERGTFNGCANFSGELNFPNLKGEIGKIWMSGTAITKILNLGDVTAILGGVASGAFNNCKYLTYVNLPATLTSIGEYGFQGCSALQVFICNATTPPTCAAASVFWNCNSTFVIYVPDASVDAYKAAAVWSTYEARIKPLSTFVEPTNE